MSFSSPMHAAVPGPRALPAGDAPAQYAGMRVLQALEVLAFHPASAPQLAATLQIDPRTARGLLGSLTREGYVRRARLGSGRWPGRYYRPTERVLALAAQAAHRTPLVSHGAATVARLHANTGADAAHLAMPCYRDIVVLAAAGPAAPPVWSLLPARDCAAGRVLLAHRPVWRHSHHVEAEVADVVADVREHGYAHTPDGQLAVPVQSDDPPLAALALTAPPDAVTEDTVRLLGALRAAAHELARKVRDDG